MTDGPVLVVSNISDPSVPRKHDTICPHSIITCCVLMNHTTFLHTTLTSSSLDLVSGQLFHSYQGEKHLQILLMLGSFTRGSEKRSRSSSCFLKENKHGEGGLMLQLRIVMSTLGLINLN